MAESKAIVSLLSTASGEEQLALVRRSWSALLSVVTLLKRRLATNTLLPGTVRKEESDYAAHVQLATRTAMNEPVPPPFVLVLMASALGYDVLLDALFRSLHFLTTDLLSLWPVAQRRVVESFVRFLAFLRPFRRLLSPLMRCLRYSKRLTSFLKLVVLVDADIRMNTIWWRSSQKTCILIFTSPLSVPPCSRNGDQMR